jgi:hypothetical protein
VTDAVQPLFDNFASNPFSGSRINNTPQELAAFDPTGNPQPQGWIGSGALDDVALFAASIRPVVIVNGLPTLPDANYPVGQFVYNTADTPARLYKNVADAWIAAVGPDDIQANSITAGQIAAGAISTSELAVSLVLPGSLANEAGGAPGVYIDSTGILIRDGKMTLQDEFGSTTMEASGFAGSWQDFIALGLYNARWAAGTATTVPNGRTAALPYWTLSDPDGADPPTATHLDPGVQVAFSVINKRKRFVSDLVPCLATREYELEILHTVTRVAGSLRLEYYLNFYDATGSFLSAGTVLSADYAATITAAPSILEGAPTDAAFMELVIEVQELTTHNAGNKFELSQVLVKQTPEILGFTAVGGITLRDTSTYGSTGVSLSGSSERLVIANGGTVGIVIGNSTFPSSPLTDTIAYREDHMMWFQFDGTRWVCTCPHSVSFTMVVDVVQPLAATALSQFHAPVPIGRGLDIFVEDADCFFLVESGGTALDGSNKWVGAVVAPVGTTTIGSLTIDSGASNSLRSATVAIDTVVDITSSNVGLRLQWTKTGTPGALRQAVMLTYRFIAT